MKLLHTIGTDEIIGHRRGVIVERYDGKLDGVHLLLSMPLPGVRMAFDDFQCAVVVARREAWFRIGWMRGVGLVCYRGTKVRSGANVQNTGRTVRLYREVSP